MSTGRRHGQRCVTSRRRDAQRGWHEPLDDLAAHRYTRRLFTKSCVAAVLACALSMEARAAEPAWKQIPPSDSAFDREHVSSAIAKSKVLPRTAEGFGALLAAIDTEGERLALFGEPHRADAERTRWTVDDLEIEASKALVTFDLDHGKPIAASVTALPLLEHLKVPCGDAIAGLGRPTHRDATAAPNSFRRDCRVAHLLLVCSSERLEKLILMPSTAPALPASATRRVPAKRPAALTGVAYIGLAVRAGRSTDLGRGRRAVGRAAADLRRGDAVRLEHPHRVGRRRVVGERGDGGDLPARARRRPAGARRARYEGPWASSQRREGDRALRLGRPRAAPRGAEAADARLRYEQACERRRHRAAVRHRRAGRGRAPPRAARCMRRPALSRARLLGVGREYPVVDHHGRGENLPREPRHRSELRGVDRGRPASAARALRPRSRLLLRRHCDARRETPELDAERPRRRWPLR